MRKLKYPLMVIGILFAASGLALLYQRLELSPPFGLTAALFLSAAVCDYRTTVKACRLGGKEGNPFVNIIFKKVGVEKGGLVTLGVLFLMVMLVFRGAPPYQQLAIGCAYWIVPINNLLVIRRLRKSKAEV